MSLLNHIPFQTGFVRAHSMHKDDKDHSSRLMNTQVQFESYYVQCTALFVMHRTWNIQANCNYFEETVNKVDSIATIN